MEKFKYKDLEHMKKVVKKEVIRLGIQDNPKLKDYNEGYIRGKAPSPSLIFTKSKMTWSEFVAELGFKPVYSSNTSKGKSNTGKKYVKISKETWANDTFRKRILNDCIVAMHEGNYGSQPEVNKNLTKDVGISFATFVNYGFVYGDFIRAYKEKYNELPHGVRSFWKYCTDKELIEGMENFFKEYGCTSFWDYKQKVHNSLAPDHKLLTRRLGEKNVYVLANGFATQYGKFSKTKSINKNKGIGKRWLY